MTHLHVTWISDTLHVSSIHVTRLKRQRLNRGRASFTLIHIWIDDYMCVTWLIRTCDMTHSDIWHASFICMTCLRTQRRLTWPIHMCDMPHSYVWHASFICVTCLIHMCDMPQSYVWHASGRNGVSHSPFICVTCLIHMCDMTHPYLRHNPYVWHDSLMHVTWLIHTCEMPQDSMAQSGPGTRSGGGWWRSLCPWSRHRDTGESWLIRMCDTTDACVTWLIRRCDIWHDSFTYVTWRIRISHGSSIWWYGWVMSHVNASCHHHMDESWLMIVTMTQ